ncbi:response regulator transcription factor [Acidovorax sp. YS12]|nr:response regulator transcription factor [Acidovorax sp. YS12]
MPEPLTVVLVEDHDDLREEMRDYLQRPQWRVLEADSGEALNQLIARHPIDVAVLDVNLPGEDGFSIAQRLRTTHPELGIVLLTARTRPSDRSTGYRAGGDVYLTKPTNVVELEAVIANLLRRVQRPQPSPCYQLLPRQQQLRAPDGHAWALTAREAQLLETLALAPQQEMDSERLLYTLGRHMGAPLTAENLAVLISRLRHKLQDPPGAGNPITGQRGKGYRLTLPLRLAPRDA